MPISAQNVRDITAEVLSSMLSLDVEDADDASGTDMMACVHVTGDHVAAIRTDVSAALAARIAEAMFGMEPGEPSEAEINDALGEIVNMIGGAVKGRLDGATALSLPMVAEGNPKSVVIPGGAVVAELHLTCESAPLRVTLLARVART